MGKKVTGNCWIDQLSQFKEIVAKTRYVASIIYITGGGQIYAKPIADYQQIFFQLYDGDLVNAYNETIVAPNNIYSQLHNIRKTKVEIFMSDDHKLNMVNMHEKHIGETTTIMTSDTKVGIKTKEEMIHDLILDMYTGPSGRFYLPDIHNAINMEDEIIMLSKEKQEKFFDKGAVYLDLDGDDFIVSRESFPLFSDTTLEFGYKLIDRPSNRFREILFIEKEELFKLYTLMRYRIG